MKVWWSKRQSLRFPVFGELYSSLVLHKSRFSRWNSMNNEPNLPPTTPSFVPRPQIQNLARQYLSLQLLQPVCLRTFHSTQVPSPSTFDHLPSSSNIPLHPRVRDPRNASPSPPSSSWIQAFSCPLEVFTFLSAARLLEDVSRSSPVSLRSPAKGGARVIDASVAFLVSGSLLRLPPESIDRFLPSFLCDASQPSPLSPSSSRAVLFLC